LTIHVPQHAVNMTLRINGEEVSNATEDGYCRIQRNWQPDDRIAVEFDMPVRRIHAHPCVRDAAGKVALIRGPLVYCVEGMDHHASLSSIVLPESAVVHTTAEEMVALHVNGIAQYASDRLYSVDSVKAMPISIRAIPYFAWGNRAPGDMQVWIREA